MALLDAALSRNHLKNMVFCSWIKTGETRYDGYFMAYHTV